MSTVTVIFPHQLYRDHPALRKGDKVALVEDSLFFEDLHHPARFHQQKLVLHRASMKYYANRLEAAGFEVAYLDFVQLEGKPTAVWVKQLAAQGARKLRYCDPVDFLLNKRLKRACAAEAMDREVLASPNFINTSEENESFFTSRKRYFMADFYQYQRKKLGILMESDGESPVGGKWSFDEENRKKLPRTQIDKIPKLAFPEENDFVKEAIGYVKEHFADNPGDAAGFRYPITHVAADRWLEQFLRQRFALFGPYEDAIVEGQPFLYHSVLTPMLNIGLLEPAGVVEKAITFAADHDVPLPSLEGFIRQIIGWREYMRAVYEREGVRMRTSNNWQHERTMPDAFYAGETGLPPLDDAIRRTLKHAYTHHIERLMVMGGFMFICRIHPQAIYRWFMEMFIDAYDWVMVPNVYAMSQNSAGGIITTKPYFSGSNYIRKMSHYPKGDWADVWDGLYWKFILDHRETLGKNPRWAMMVATANRMSEAKRKTHLENAEKFLGQLF